MNIWLPTPDYFQVSDNPSLEVCNFSSCFTYHSIVKLATISDQKAPFSIAITHPCRGGCYFFRWIAPLYLPKGICLKVNVIAQLGYKLAYYNSAVHCFNHYTTRTPLDSVLVFLSTCILFDQTFFKSVSPNLILHK